MTLGNFPHNVSIGPRYSLAGFARLKALLVVFRAQCPLVKEYTLAQNMKPFIIIYGIFVR